MGYGLTAHGGTGRSFQGILGRDTEVSEVARFIESVHGGPSALLLEGAAGIGKTTLWHAGVTFARDTGHQVLSSRAAESEARLSYAALGDLLELELPELPGPQKRALDAALLRDEVEGSPPDQRAVSLATLAVLRALAASGPVIIAIDDIQWLDAASVRVLSFAARRLRDEPIRILVAMRSGSGGDPLGLDRMTGSGLRRLRVGPLGEETMIRLLRDHIGEDLAHPILRRLHSVSHGNPFFALEIARALANQAVRPEPGEPLPVPEDLHELLGARLSALPSSAADAMLIVAAATRPTVDLVLGATPDPDRALAGISKAEEADIVERSGERIEFTHPLLGSTVYAAASTETRRRLHRRLADVVLDPEEGARHLALAAGGADRGVAEALDTAGRHAVARGAPDAAAELAELALKVTPPEDVAGILRRRVDAAVYHFDAGDAARSFALLEGTIANGKPGPDRARILFQLAAISWLDLPRVQALCEQALEEAGGEPTLSSAILEHLAWVGIYRGDLVDAAKNAKASTEHARQITDLTIRGDALSTFGMVEFLLGRPAEDSMHEALRLQDRAISENQGVGATGYTPSRACYGLQLLWAGRLDRSRDILQQELTGFEERGRYLVRDEILCYLAEVECRAGNWETAARHAEEAYEIDVESGRLLGRGHTLFPKALIEAHRGEVDTARTDAEEGLRLCMLNEDLLDASCNGAVLGFLELSLSDPAAAIERLDPVLGFLEAMGSSEPGIIPCVPDAIEALVALGELERGDELLLAHAEKGRALDRPWALATAARCRGLLAAGRGDQPSSMAAFEEAMEHHVRLDMPFELGRSLLALGEAQRRFKQRRAAGGSFRAALETFERLGAPLWAEKARADLARIGGHAAEPGALTPTERRVAELASEGRTNREVADALFVSVKTVEANLSRIFQKLGIRSRRQLRGRAIRPANPEATPRSDRRADPRS
jgi:DNA-binding CsgD family transcriptional regulator